MSVYEELINEEVSLREKLKYIKEKDDDAPTGGTYSSFDKAFKDKIKLLMKQKRPRPGVASTKAGRRQQARDAGESGYVGNKRPHATKF